MSDYLAGLIQLAASIINTCGTIVNIVAQVLSYFLKGDNRE